MRRIYSHPDLAVVHLVKNELENRGIDAVVRGEHLAGVAGGGASMEAWFELWVADGPQLQEAAQVIRGVVEPAGDEGGAPWTCPGCGEDVEPSFAACWRCGRERAEEGT